MIYLKRLNNKGFAITTIVYGLAIMSTMILTLVMSMLATTRTDNSNLSKELEAELNRYSKTSVVFEATSTGSGQEFIVPEGEGGWYRVELWGAQGSGEDGGLGAYTSGVIKLEENDILYFVIGKNGATDVGGGATDVRLENTNTPSSMETRIMVAAGGGKLPGAAGGTLVGYTSTMLAPGGKIKIKDEYQLETNTTLLGFTVSGSMTSFGNSVITQTTSTPGGHPNATNPGGEGYITSTNEAYGGVSFISGYLGSRAYIKGTLTTNSKYTYYKKENGLYAAEGRDYYFVDGIMLPGVKTGDGHAKIERVASAETITELPRVNTKLDKVSKVRDCISNTNVVKNIISISVAVNGSTMTNTLTDDNSVAGSVCKVLTLASEQNVDEIAVFHHPGYDYINHTIEVYSNGDWKTVKGKGLGYNISETETATGIRISAYQPDYTTTLPETGNYYIIPVTAEAKAISGFSSSDDRANPLQVSPLVGEIRQKWSIEKLSPKLEKAGVNEYKIVELTRYNALTIYKDENMEGNQLIVSSFNNLARNEPSIWQVKPMGDGTVVITSSAPTFTSSKVTGNIYVQTNSSIVDNYNSLVIGRNRDETQRFKLIKLDY